MRRAGLSASAELLILELAQRLGLMLLLSVSISIGYRVLEIFCHHVHVEHY